MSIQSHTPVPPGHAVRVVLTARVNKGLYGYAYGPFRYDELRGCFVYGNTTYSLEEWAAQGGALLEKLARYRPGVRIEVFELPKEIIAHLYDNSVIEPVVAPVEEDPTLTTAPRQAAEELRQAAQAAEISAPVKRARRSPALIPV